MTGQAQEVQEALTSVVARNLRIAQAAAEVSNRDLAAAVGVSPRTVGKWRRGEIEITISSLERVARALGRDVAWFMATHASDRSAA